MEHCFCQYLKPISPTSDSFLLIMSHISFQYSSFYTFHFSWQSLFCLLNCNLPSIQATKRFCLLLYLYRTTIWYSVTNALLITPLLCVVTESFRNWMMIINQNVKLYFGNIILKEQHLDWQVILMTLIYTYFVLKKK